MFFVKNLTIKTTKRKVSEDPHSYWPVYIRYILRKYKGTPKALYNNAEFLADCPRVRDFITIPDSNCACKAKLQKFSMYSTAV